MMTMLGFGGFEFVIIGVVAALMVGLVFWQSRNRKKMAEQQDQMSKSLRPGLRIKTVAGVIGRIKEIREEAPHLTTVLIETGNGKDVSYMLVDVNAIMAVIDEEMLLRAKEDQSRIEAEKRIEAARQEAEARIANTTISPKSNDITSSDDPTPDFDAAAFVEKSNASRNTTKKRTTQKKS